MTELRVLAPRSADQHASRSRLRRPPEADTILLLESDAQTVTELQSSLRPLGLTVLAASNPLRLVARLNAAGVCAVVLNAAPGPVPLSEVVKVIRSESAVPVLVACASTDVASIGPAVLEGARAIALPYRVGEIAQIIDQSPLPRQRADRLTLGVLTLITESIDAHVRDTPLDLSALEFDLFHMLAERAGYSVTRDELIDALWSDCRTSADDLLVAAVKRVRRKLAEAGVLDAIQTVRGVGYRLNPGVFSSP